MVRQLIHQRRAVVYAQPTQQKLHEAWTGKVSPAISGAGLGGWLPTEGQGARGGQTPKFVVFREPQSRARAGMLYLIHGGGKSEGAQASVSAPTVLVDEVDSFKGAHRIALIGKRADSFGKTAIRILTSTVKADGEPGSNGGSIILGSYQDSTRSRLWYACPHCREWGPLEWEQVRYDPEDESLAAESVALACPHCAALISESERQGMLTDPRMVHHSQTVSDAGEVIGAEPRTLRFGLLWTALDSTLRDLPTMAIEHWRATMAVGRGDHGAMRSFYRDQLCRPYRGDIVSDDSGHTLVPTRNRLAALSAASHLVLAVDRRDEDGDSVHLCEIPAWCEHLTVGVDVQRGGETAPGRLYWVVLGRGPDARGALLGWGQVVAAPAGRAPTTGELHASLDRLHQLLTDWSPSAPIVARGVDVGDRQDEIRAWLRIHPEWRAIKGTGPLKPDERDLAGWVYSRKQDAGWMLYLVETNAVSRIVHGELLAGTGPGSMLMPPGQARLDALPRHFCATVEYQPGKWSVCERDRVHHPEWQRRHDYLDCLAYARALAYQWEVQTSQKRPQIKRRFGVVGKALV